MKCAIYPGTFDPITNGHLDIIKRGLNLFDKIYVCIGDNLNKKTYFSKQERIAMVKDACKDLANVEVIYTDSLVVRKAKELGCCAIIRGLRAVTDYEYELQLAAGNEYIDNSIETVFLMASSGKGFISSSSIKEFYFHNVDITNLVPTVVKEGFANKNK